MASLITFPLRLGVRTARASLQATRDLADLGLATLQLVGRALGEEPPHDRHVVEFEVDVEAPVAPVAPVTPVDEPAPAPAEVVPPPAPAETVAPPPPARRPRRAQPTRPARPQVVRDTATDIGLAPEPHTPDDRELVEEFADPGAEDGAGASLRIEPPFEGYDELRAADLIARLSTLDAAALGETELYERTHRARRTVLAAIDREQRRRGPA